MTVLVSCLIWPQCCHLKENLTGEPVGQKSDESRTGDDSVTEAGKRRKKEVIFFDPGASRYVARL